MNEAGRIANIRTLPARLLTWAMLIGCAIALGTLVLTFVRYVMSASYIDHIESTMTILEYNYLHGRPIYDLPNGIMRFSALYGPLAYLTHIGAMLVLGQSVLAAKLAVGVAVAATIIMLLFHFRQGPGMGVPIGVLTFVIAGLIFFHKSLLWIRAEPFITFLVALAVSTAYRRGAPWVLGFCIGAAVGFKIHAVVFFIPLILESLLRGGRRNWMITAAVALLAAVTPFALPGIDLASYLESIRQHVGGRAVEPDLVFLAVWASLIFCLPILLVMISEKIGRSRVDSVFIWSALATMTLLLYPASLQGAGVYHFLPFVPVLVAAYVRAGPVKTQCQLVPATILLVTLTTSVPVLARFQPAAFGRELSDEILGVTDDPSLQPVQIGFGETIGNYPVVQASRVALTLAGYPPVVDAQVLMELGVRGIDGSARWIPLLRQCAVKTWLVPAGEKPFLMGGYYSPSPIFSEGFREAFHAHYRLARPTGFFELWECQKK